MIIKTCIGCRYHSVKKEDTEKSYCGKEVLWSIYTKCIKRTALDILVKSEQRGDQASRSKLIAQTDG